MRAHSGLCNRTCDSGIGEKDKSRLQINSGQILRRGRGAGRSVAEQRNRTLLEMVRSTMAQANLPIHYWGDAWFTTAYVLNRVPSKSVSSTPYELWTGREPNLSELHPWGCAAYILDSFHKFGQLGPRGKKCIFIIYSTNSKGYVFIGEDNNGRIT